MFIVTEYAALMETPNESFLVTRLLSFTIAKLPIFLNIHFCSQLFFAVKTVICFKFFIDRQRKTGPGMIGLCQALFFIGCFLLNSRSTENVIYLNLNYKTLLLVKINGSFGVRIQIIGDFSS